MASEAQLSGASFTTHETTDTGDERTLSHALLALAIIGSRGAADGHRYGLERPRAIAGYAWRASMSVER